MLELGIIGQLPPGANGPGSNLQARKADLRQHVLRLQRLPSRWVVQGKLARGPRPRVSRKPRSQVIVHLNADCEHAQTCSDRPLA